VAGRPMGAGGLRVTPSVGATCALAGEHRPAALLQGALQVADEVAEGGGNAYVVV
jgi:hypothetical protein